MKLYFKESMSLLKKTLPFVFLKWAIYMGISVVFLLFAGLTLWIAFKFQGLITLIILIIGLVIFWGVIKFVRQYILYLVKAGHIAVLAELVQNGSLPEGQKVLSYGFNKVKTNFVTSSVFFLVDKAVTAVVHGITRLINKIGDMIPIPAVKKAFDLIAAIISIFLSYIDEAVLSFIFIHPDKNPWKGARDGLVLYFKSWKPLLASASLIVIVGYGLIFGIFFVLQLATAPIAAAIPVFKDAPFIIALLLALLIKAMFLDPFILTVMIVTYNNSIKGMSSDSATMDKLAGLVPKFKEIVTNAGGKGGAVAAGTPAVAKQSSAPIKKGVSTPLSPEMEKQVKSIIPSIKQNRKQGYDDASIKKALKSNGWNDKIIDEALKRA